MKRIFLVVIFLFPALLFAQCKDTIRQPDKYHYILTPYAPVCGCDGITYRNSDAAYWWGAINQWNSDGPCESFDIDFYPNVITPDPDYRYGLLSIYMKNPGTATVLIYNSFGRLMYEHLFSASLPKSIIPDGGLYKLPEPQTYQTGVYILLVIVNGDKKAVKFFKVAFN